MPYKRRFRKRYRRRKKYGYFGRAGNDAKSAMRMAGKALSLINVEYKNLDTQLTSQAQSDTPTITQITNMNRGDTTNTRDGSSVKFVQLYMRGFVRINASATRTGFRILVVLDRQTNQAVYAIADLLQDVSNADGLVTPLNLDNKFRFHVLYDKLMFLDSNGVESKQFKFFKKVQLKCRYDGDAGTIADLTSKSLSIVTLSDEATNTPVVTLNMRLRFVDN